MFSYSSLIPTIFTVTSCRLGYEPECLDCCSKTTSNRVVIPKFEGVVLGNTSSLTLILFSPGSLHLLLVSLFIFTVVYYHWFRVVPLSVLRGINFRLSTQQRHLRHILAQLISGDRPNPCPHSLASK